MNTASSDTAMTTAIAATEQTEADAALQLKLLSLGFTQQRLNLPALGDRIPGEAMIGSRKNARCGGDN
jgi:hypothetical protein